MSWMDDYEPVASRIPKFWADHPKGRIVTQVNAFTDADVIVEARLYREGEDEPFATGFAHEVPGQGNVNRTSCLENCETSAIGRALANAGYAPADPNRRASREEMAKVERHSPRVCGVCGEPLAGSAVTKVDGRYVHQECGDGSE